MNVSGVLETACQLSAGRLLVGYLLVSAWLAGWLAGWLAAGWLLIDKHVKKHER